MKQVYRKRNRRNSHTKNTQEKDVISDNDWGINISGGDIFGGQLLSMETSLEQLAAEAAKLVCEPELVGIKTNTEPEQVHLAKAPPDLAPIDTAPPVERDQKPTSAKLLAEAQQIPQSETSRESLEQTLFEVRRFAVAFGMKGEEKAAAEREILLTLGAKPKRAVATPYPTLKQQRIFERQAARDAELQSRMIDAKAVKSKNKLKKRLKKIVKKKQKRGK